MAYPKLIENLIEKLCWLPGIGRRSAERMAFWLLDHTKDEAEGLAESIIQLKEKLMFCKRCHNLSEENLCTICNDPARDQSLICVVEEPKDLLAIDRSGSYKGLYHVLLGNISPAEGRGPEDLNIASLMTRLESEPVKEVVIATDPDNDGEMTSLYLMKLLRPKGIKVSRIGLGIPVGSSVEYADLSTLSMALNARRVITD